jgi:hypothetical protein
MYDQYVSVRALHRGHSICSCQLSSCIAHNDCFVGVANIRGLHITLNRVVISRHVGRRQERRQQQEWSHLFVVVVGSYRQSIHRYLLSLVVLYKEAPKMFDTINVTSYYYGIHP